MLNFVRVSKKKNTARFREIQGRMVLASVTICRDNGTIMNPVARRSLLIFALAVTFWCGFILLAPSLRSLGESGAWSSGVVYEFFARICHQNEARSFHIFGEKLGVCIRCSGIYGTFWIGVVVWLMAGWKRGWSVPHRRWLLLAALPMVVDVLFHWSGIRGATDVSRIMTGGLFGAVLPLYILPAFSDAMVRIFASSKTPGLHSSQGETLHARKA